MCLPLCAQARRCCGLPSREEGDFAGVGLVTIQLIELAAADVLQEDDELAGLRAERAAGDGLGQERELATITTGHFDVVQLRGIGEARGDEHPRVSRGASYSGGGANSR